jgi:hypothetical protein
MVNLGHSGTQWFLVPNIHMMSVVHGELQQPMER